jgi:hypothetical protein
MVKKTKQKKRNFGEDSTFGRVYEFRGVRYWLYKRKDDFGDYTKNYYTKCQGQSKNVPAWRSKSVPLGLKNIGS